MRRRPSLEGLLVEAYRRLLRWRRYVGAVARAAADLLGHDARVYVVDGAAEGRLTVLSDIDIVIVSRSVPRDEAGKQRLRLEVRDRAVTRYGLPWDYPVDIHLYNEEEFRAAGGRYRRMIKIQIEWDREPGGAGAQGLLHGGG